jgi:hypothetical protein
LRRDSAKKLVGDGGQQSGAVTAAPIGVHAPAMRQPQQGFQRAFHDFVRPTAAELRDKAYSAGIVIDRGWVRQHASLSILKEV